MSTSFWKSGHVPTLFAAFLYFDLSFMVWVLIGVLANSIAPELGLSAAEKGVLVAVPILGGALLSGRGRGGRLAGAHGHDPILRPMRGTAS